MKISDRLNRLESVVLSTEQNIASLTAKIGSIAEKIDDYLETHNTVIRLDERIKTANQRIKDLEDDQKVQAKEITAIKVKYASIAAIISIAGSFFTTIILNSVK